MSWVPLHSMAGWFISSTRRALWQVEAQWAALSGEPVQVRFPEAPFDAMAVELDG